MLQKQRAASRFPHSGKGGSFWNRPCMVSRPAPQWETELVRRCGGAGLLPAFAAFAGQKLDSFGEGLAIELHHKINGVAALAPAVAKPLVTPDGQAVVFLPAVFSAALDELLALRTEKIFQTDSVRPVDLCLGVIHRSMSSFLCPVWVRFWDVCSTVRPLF